MHKLLRALAVTMIFVSTTVQSSERLSVSMIQLIANPQQFDGKPIRLMAYLNLEFEGDALYLHREDYDKGLWSNALSISLEDHHFPKVKKLSRGYVVVEGIFSAKIRGHFGMFSGSVQQVTRIQKYERPQK